MFSSLHNQPKLSFLFTVFLVTNLLFPTQVQAVEKFAQNPKQILEFKQFSGKVVAIKTNKPLVFASLRIVHSNITTITNSEGEFTLKVPIKWQNGQLEISMLGYKKRVLLIADLKVKKNKIELEPTVVKLSEVVLTLQKDAQELVVDMFNNTAKNYASQPVLMTAFYRESIKKRTRNVSLAEAIVTIYKQPNTNSTTDKIELYKARKSTDYTRLDTIALKLQGGPFNALFVDMIKYPHHVFTPETIGLYKYSYSPSTSINSRSVYVVNFEQKIEYEKPLFYGKLYIDVQTHALISAMYSLDVTNRKRAAKLFVKKKPRDIFVYPTAVSYRVDYRKKDDKWYYGYSNAQLTFKIKRKGKWFKTTYSVNSEMLVTDWEFNSEKEKPKFKDRMRYSIIISDEASGFSDPDFWGEFNVIEPDKPIENAIKKIRKKLVK